MRRSRSHEIESGFLVVAGTCCLAEQLCGRSRNSKLLSLIEFREAVDGREDEVLEARPFAVRLVSGCVHQFDLYGETSFCVDFEVDNDQGFSFVHTGQCL